MTIIRDAIISPCKQYRYQLERSWSEQTSRNSTVVFIGLNPSTADLTKDDPTIRKCMTYAQAWQFKKLVMVNLFSWRTTNPNELMQAKNPVGRLTDKYLDEAVSRSALVVACWGEYGTFLGRSDDIRARYQRRLSCLSTNQSGEPTHPLYLPATLTPVKLRKKSGISWINGRTLPYFSYHGSRLTWFQLRIKRERSSTLRLPPQL